MNRLFLLSVGLVFVAYGLACAIDPALPARLAGLSITNGDGYAELGAMYGGLQIGVGLFCLLGARHDRYRSSALVLLVLAIGLLAAIRALSALRTDEVLTAYSWGALAFETFVTASAALFLSRKAPE